MSVGLLRILLVSLAALALVVFVEFAAGPFGTPWDGMFGISVGVLAIIGWVWPQ